MSIIQGSAKTSVGGYQIQRSLRFNSADTAYLNRTPASPGNRQTWTWSGWVKRGLLSTQTNLFYAGGGSTTDYTLINFPSNDTFQITQNDSSVNTILYRTAAVFRDPSAWYHLMVSVDTTQATAADRAKIYINGVQQTIGLSTTATLNQDTFVNYTTGHTIGVFNSVYANCYLTEVNFIDGQALTPSSFGQTNPSTGVWEPVKYTGTYGTNGFYLNFSDNSGTTSTTLGKDSSGNGNNWTPNGFVITAGDGNDSLVDTPTSYGTDTGVGGEVRGNYCTLNPLDKNSGITLTNGNLDASMPTQLQNVYGSVSISSGKYYWETTINSLSGRIIIGVGNTVDQSWNLDPSSSANLWGYYSVNGNKLNNSNTAYGNSYTAGDVIGVAVDMDSGKIWFRKGATWQASGDPAAGTNAAFTNLSGSVRPVYNQQLTNAVTISCNFGQRPFANSAPSGFKALCTQNLPTPTIGATSTTQANDYFNTVLYTGTGSSQSITGVGFQPDFVWIKGRSGATDHGLYDAVRGVQKQLESNTTTEETTETTGLTAFGSDGFTVGALAQLNTSTATYVGWNWNGGGSNATNTSGTITSTVRANTTAGFSVVTYTGTSANATIGHGLGVAPSMIIVKSRSVAADWAIYHASLPNNTYSIYFDTGGQNNAVNNWNSTSPTSSVFSVIGTSGYVNTSPRTYVAYCFAPVAGYSAFGSYSGNNSATDGTFVYLGFRPRFLMIKSTSAGTDWVMVDTTRSTYNLADTSLYADSANSESTIGTVNDIDILSNGFKLRNNTGFVNASQTYIYAAFAESPFKYSLAR